MQRATYLNGEISQVGPLVKIKFDREPELDMKERLKNNGFYPYMNQSIWIRRKNESAIAAAEIIMQEA